MDHRKNQRIGVNNKPDFWIFVKEAYKSKPANQTPKEVGNKPANIIFHVK